MIPDSKIILCKDKGEGAEGERENSLSQFRCQTPQCQTFLTKHHGRSPSSAPILRASDTERRGGGLAVVSRVHQQLIRFLVAQMGEILLGVSDP